MLIDTSLGNACIKCKSLSCERKGIISARVSLSTQILFLVGSPELRDTVESGLLSGSAGKFLYECIRAAGYSESDPAFGFISTVRCKGVDTKGVGRPAKDAEIHNCYDYIEQEIQNLPNLKIIVCLGSIAANRLFGKLGMTIHQFRKHTIWHPRYKVRTIVTYDPELPTYSTVLQERSILRASIIEDIQKAVKLLQTDYQPLEHTSYVCNTIEKVKWLFKNLNEQELVAWDTETDSLDYLDSNILCHSFSWKEGTGAVLPILQQYSKPFWSKEDEVYVKGELQKFLENPYIKKIAHNGKFDVQQCRAQGIKVNNFYADTMLAHYCAFENVDHNLKLLAWLFTDYGGYEDSLKDIMKKYAKQNNLLKREASYNILPAEILWPYAGKDTDVTLQIYHKFMPILKKEGTDDIYFNMYMPFCKLVSDMEFEGMSIDKDYLKETQQLYLDRIAELEKRILLEPSVKTYINNKKDNYRKERLLKYNASKNLQSRYTKEEYQEKGIEKIEFNYGSTKQLKELFIDQLKIKVGKRTDKGRASFDAEAMEYYAKKVSVAKIIAEINKASNLLTTFLDGIATRIRKDGKIHTSLNMHIAETGRLSSSDPNLQNIPNVTKNPVDAKLIRNIFIADSVKCKILEFDMKQAEFRIWSQLSQDPVLIADLKAGLDIHKEIAAQGFKVPREEVTKDQRNGAKGVVFGKMYGRGNKSVAEQLGISEKEAEKIEGILFSKYKVASAWLKNTVKFAEVNKYVVNCFGFRRHLDGWIDSYDQAMRATAKRLAVNAPIQGGASQMVCYAMLKVDRLFKEHQIRGRLLFPIHDAILFNVHEEDIHRAVPLIEESMTHPHPVINVPLGIDGKIGYKWGDAIDAEKYLEENK